ncbi:MAG TPA: Holliday junction branch migration protein RuvA [Methanoregulaceae archaeon]|nr:Holliday junction branch migration protein RuvA [Methanolinea sp.]MDD3090569.1 Holliday junction branch migration protein RuvA [Methanoregulaceae archaeon]MDD5048128.1 Holliday junction branch migration protein RuvA [Methanoregulaceae archaeon]MDD5684410.1 Holliday junction branch migration protein RuvA [Methanoregulaceae archaeon]HOP67339.1 Holliday junction branch migration protein RuvA [Methanoregulaceae archaeon]
MISHLCGTVTSVGESSAVIDVGGVGYLVNMTAPDLRELKPGDGRVRVYTHMSVREDGISLHGFLRSDALEMFLMLISVNRVGPSLAQNILSQITLPEFAAAIIGEDEKILTQISGIGNKNAKRLILELRDRMEKKAILYRLETKSRDPVRDDAVLALLSLGFGQKESREAVDNAMRTEESPGLQEIIKAALVQLKEK